MVDTRASEMKCRVAQGDLLLEPDAQRIGSSNLSKYLDGLKQKHGLHFPDYPSLWQWSVEELETFWGSIAEYFEVRFHQSAKEVLASRQMPGATWFPGATLNYAEHALRAAGPGDAPAILFATEPEEGKNVIVRELSREELSGQVAALAQALRQMGVRRGDRVAGYFSNAPEAVVAFLATVSLGAIWSNCPADLSSRGVLDRFIQIEPKVLVAVESYRYGGKRHFRRTVLEEIADGLPTLENLILIPGERELDAPRETFRLRPEIARHEWNDILARPAEAPLHFEAVPFDHPLWILYSSGTTGIPKAIVQGHGGILLEHLKVLSFHLDLRPGDRFFWYTSSGWMMWNLLVSGLLLPGVTVVLYDGSPKFPTWEVLWNFVAKNRITCFGTSAPYLLACIKEGIEPHVRYDLAKLRAIGSTGAPLPPEAFGWIHEKVKRDLWIGSISGGTDVCTAFVLSHPHLPVYAGEIQCLGLGAKVETWNERQESVFGEVGELVLTAPFPSMPVFFWNDPEGVRLRSSYFEKFPGTWCHGDWMEIASPAERCVIHGRSDATLNRGGVRMGTAEFYAILEDLPEVLEALVIDTGGLGRKDLLLLFVVLREKEKLDQALQTKIIQQLRREVSPRHVPDVIYQVAEIPHTLNGKKLEVPVKRVLLGMSPAKAVSRDAMANPDSLIFFEQLAGELKSL